MLGTLKLSSPAWGGEVEGEWILELPCLPTLFIEELGTGWEAGPAVGSRCGQQEGPTANKSHNPPTSNLPSMFTLMLYEAWQELAQLCSSPNYTRNSPPGYPQICSALVIF